MTSPTGAARLAAVVLHYRSAAETAAAVAALRRSQRPVDDLIVVDHGGAGVRDCGVDAQVDVVTTPANLGFSGGVNAGIRRAMARGADLVLILNDDVTVSPDCNHPLERGLRQAAAAVAGPLVVDRRSPGRVLSRGLAFSPWTGRMTVMGHGERTAARPADVRVTDAVSGCAMLVDAKMFPVVGLFDEAYFFGFEDLDFCLRARAHAFRTVVVPGAVVEHLGGASMGDSPRRLYFAARNHLRLAARVAESGRLHSAARGSAIVVLNLLHAMFAIGGTWSARMGAVVRGTRDYTRGRFGPDAEAAASRPPADRS
jgi:GT2 family glycosyltransferase